MHTLDVKEFLQDLRATKPPYSCPVPKCDRIYKSYAGIQFHLYHFDHETGTVIASPTPDDEAAGKDEKGGRKSGGRTRWNRCSSPTDLPNAPVLKIPIAREGLTYAEAQKIVEIDIEGVTYRINIDEALPFEIIDGEEEQLPEAARGVKPEVGVTSYPAAGADMTSQTPLTPHVVRKRSGKFKRSNRTGFATPRSKPKNKNINSAKKLKDGVTNGLPVTPTPVTTLQLTAPPAEPPKPTLPQAKFSIIADFHPQLAPKRPQAYYRFIEKTNEELDEAVEYDMDEEDCAWLGLMNDKRKREGVSGSVTADQFELLMDRLEKESYFQSQSTAGTCNTGPAIDDDAVCAICQDGECHNANAILFCDMCNLAVHQECYGVPYIPEGQWLCRRCLQSPSRAVDCVLCPNKGGAFKQTDDGRWAHVVCALWVPEVCFANTVFLEPIDGLQNIPAARWKLSCYVCKQRSRGACIQCHKANCYTAFHVTCAQQAGLYMKLEEVRDVTSGGPGYNVRKTAFCDVHAPHHTPRRKKSRDHNRTTNEKGGAINGRGGSSTAAAINGRKNGGRVPMYKRCDDSDDDDDDDNSGSDDGGDSDGATSNASDRPMSGDEARRAQAASREKMRKARKILAEKRCAVPVVAIPTIPQDRLGTIASLVQISKRIQFLQRLVAYWTLKRQSRNGVPLLRRLQMCHLPRRDPDSEKHTSALREQHKYFQRLRQDLERARLLCELIRKREKLKREALKMSDRITRLRISPFNCFLEHVLERLQEKDTMRIFAEPVDVKEVPDYGKIIAHPMDFSTMATKIRDSKYSSVQDLEKDFNVMINNCLTYNPDDTIFYKSAVKLKDQGDVILRMARHQASVVGYTAATGMHTRSIPHQKAHVVETPEQLESYLKSDGYQRMDWSKKLDVLRDRQATICLEPSGASQTRKLKMLKGEISKARRRLTIEMRGKSPKKKRGFVKKSASSKDRQQSADADATTNDDDDDDDATNDGDDDDDDDTSDESTDDDDDNAPAGDDNDDAGSKNKKKVVSAAAARNDDDDNDEAASKKKKKIVSVPAAARNANDDDDETSSSSSSSSEEEPMVALVTPAGRRGRPAKLAVNATTAAARNRALKRRLSSTSEPKTPVKATTKAPETPALKSPTSDHETKATSANRRSTRASDAAAAATHHEASLPLTVASPPHGGRRSNTTKDAPAAATPLSSPPLAPPTKRSKMAANAAAPSSSGATPTINNTTASVVATRRSSEGVQSPPTAGTRASRRSNVAASSGPGHHDDSETSHHPDEHHHDTRKTRAHVSVAPSVATDENTEEEETDTATVCSERIGTTTTVKHDDKSDALSLGKQRGVAVVVGRTTRKSPQKTAVVMTSSVASVAPSRFGSGAPASKLRLGPSMSLDGDDDDDDDDDSTQDVGKRCRGLASLSQPGTPQKSSHSTAAGLLFPSSPIPQTDSFKVYRSGGGGGSSEEDDDEEESEHSETEEESTEEEEEGKQEEEQEETVSALPTTRGRRRNVKKEAQPLSVDDEKRLSIPLEPLDLVWAKCRGYPWYPALIINPDMPREGFTQNGVPIPVPPEEVVALRAQYPDRPYLILFFDTKRTWQWLSRDKLEPLGAEADRDSAKLTEPRKPNERKAVKRAFDLANAHRRRVAGEADD